MNKMNSREGWSEPIRACDILNLPETLIDEKPGIYVWRRNAHQEPEALISDKPFIEWCQNQIQPVFLKTPVINTPQSIKNNKVHLRSGFLKMKALEMGCNEELSVEKKESLQRVSKSPKSREEFSETISSAINYFGNVFYVGESSNLRVRILQHARGSTNLIENLEAVGISTNAVAVQFRILEGYSAKERRLVEQILTYSLFAPLTMRPG